MKLIITTICIGFLFAASSLLADTYEGSMTGIACTGCKKKILSALGGMDGVLEARIAAKEDKDGQYKLTVKTDGSIEITEEDAKKTVAVAEHYKMTSWKKVEIQE